MKHNLFVFHGNQDGEVRVYKMDVDDFLDDLLDDYWGERPNFVEELTSDVYDLQSLDGLLVILGGDIVVPVKTKIEGTTTWQIYYGGGFYMKSKSND